MTNTIIARLVVLIALLASASSRLGAQCSDKWRDPKRLHLRETFDKKLAVAPAYAQAVFPVGGRRSEVIAAGVKYDIPCLGISQMVTLARNNQLEKEQSVFKAGAEYAWVTRIGTNWSLDFSTTASYKRDGVKKSEGHEESLLFSPVGPARLRSNPLGILIPNNGVRLFGTRFTQTPYFGLEYEDGRASGVTESVTRVLQSYQLEVFPNAEAWKWKVQIVSTAEYRNDLARSGVTGSKRHPWFNAAISYLFFSDPTAKRSAGLALKYMKGENPSEGLARQEATMLVLKIQY